MSRPRTISRDQAVIETNGPLHLERAPAGALDGLVSGLYIGILKAQQDPDFMRRFQEWKIRRSLSKEETQTK